MDMLDKSPFEKSPESHFRGFFFVGLALWLHDSIFQKSKLYSERSMLPIGKFEMELFHREKVLEDKPPYSPWK
jgi:hypothetical protein